MRQLASTALGLAASLAIVSEVRGADQTLKAPVMPYSAPLAVPVWTGFYTGFNGGWAWESDVKPIVEPVGVTSAHDFDSTFNLVGTAPFGAMAGGQFGFNWQTGFWVFGAEFDFDRASITGVSGATVASLLAPLGNSDGAILADQLKWFGTARGRIGYANGPWMVYGTAGVAWRGDTRDTMICANTGIHVYGDCAIGSHNETLTGWVAGIGGAYMIDPAGHWNVFAEFLHAGFSGNTVTPLVLNFANCAIPGCGAQVSRPASDLNIFRVGINYKF